MWFLIEKIVLVEVEVEYYDKESFMIWVKFKVVELVDYKLVGV